MKIGIFTDAYAPKVNGISIVALTTKAELEAQGHEVYIFAPGFGLHRMREDEPRVFRFPALSGDRILFEDARISLFFPPLAVKKVLDLNLDIIHVLTPNIVGLLGIYVAKKHRIPLVQQYCTDVVEYAYRYPNTLPAIMATTVLALPFIGKLNYKRLLAIAREFTPRLRPSDWSKRMVLQVAPYVYDQSDHIVAVSRKVERSLQNMGVSVPISVIPTGVEPLPYTASAVQKLRKEFGLKKTDKVILSVGRLSREKNLDLLIDMFELVAEKEPNALLLFVGDYDYRAILEEKASESRSADRILFAGKIPHEELGPVYGLAEVFAFPSVTDTQGLVIHEAAEAGLPVVMIDSGVTEVVKDGVNGFIAKNNPKSFAHAVHGILSDAALQREFSEASKQMVAQYTATNQTNALLDTFTQTITDYSSAADDR